jgi:hypothetical protein
MYVSCGFKSGHQKGTYPQNSLTILKLIVNIIRERAEEEEEVT